jgi:nicotinamidase-related amidase
MANRAVDQKSVDCPELDRSIDLENLLKKHEIDPLNENTVLLVIDIQNDFCEPEGALSVNDATETIREINYLTKMFRRVVFTQDYHCKNHLSFVSEHTGKQAYDQIETEHGLQTLWPAHCVQNTRGADFHDSLFVPDHARVVRKGNRREVDSYSAFLENDLETETGLREYLCTNESARREREGDEFVEEIDAKKRTLRILRKHDKEKNGEENVAVFGSEKQNLAIQNVVLVGVAYDYCVRSSSIDAAKFFQNVFVIERCTKAVNLNKSVEDATTDMLDAGVHII